MILLVEQRFLKKGNLENYIELYNRYISNSFIKNAL